MRPALCGLVSSYRPGPLGFHRTCHPREAPGEAGVRPPSFLSTSWHCHSPSVAVGKADGHLPAFARQVTWRGTQDSGLSIPGKEPRPPRQTQARRTDVPQWVWASPHRGPALGGPVAPAHSPPRSPASCLRLALPPALAGTLRKQGLGYTDSQLEPDGSGHCAPSPSHPHAPHGQGCQTPPPAWCPARSHLGARGVGGPLPSPGSGQLPTNASPRPAQGTRGPGETGEFPKDRVPTCQRLHVATVASARHATSTS